MRTIRPTLFEWWLAPAAVLGLFRSPAVHVPAGTGVRQYPPALCPHEGVYRLWQRLSARERLFAGEHLLALVGSDLRLARPAERSHARFVAGAGDGHLCPRVLCAAAQSHRMTGKQEQVHDVFSRREL